MWDASFGTGMMQPIMLEMELIFSSKNLWSRAQIQTNLFLMESDPQDMQRGISGPVAKITI
jgi:hypothetical protein